MKQELTLTILFILLSMLSIWIYKWSTENPMKWKRFIVSWNWKLICGRDRAV
jgi:hypothetical protein